MTIVQHIYSIIENLKNKITIDIEYSLKLFHNIVGFIHCIITFLVSIYLLNESYYDPLEELSYKSYVILTNTVILSSIYYFFGTIALFFDKWTTRSLEYLIHHMLAIIIPMTSVMMYKYTKILSLLYTMEMSSMLICSREFFSMTNANKIVRNINDILFVISFALCRSYIPIYITYTVVSNYHLFFDDPIFLIYLPAITIGNVLNIYWFFMIVNKIYLLINDVKK
jgi:hypothetical protein